MKNLKQKLNITFLISFVRITAVIKSMIHIDRSLNTLTIQVLHCISLFFFF